MSVLNGLIKVLRISRISTFASLALSLLTTSSDDKSTVLSTYLRRLRGGALKLGQMLSLQDTSVLPPEWSKALDNLRNKADTMPAEELDRVFRKEWGVTIGDVNGGRRGGFGLKVYDSIGRDREDDDGHWLEEYSSITPSNILSEGSSPISVDDIKFIRSSAFASASIGQVHLATLKCEKHLILKVQYPRILESITNDIANLQSLIGYLNVVPRGVFLDEIVEQGLREVEGECDYLREMRGMARYRDLLEADHELKRLKFQVPKVVPSLTTKRILVTEYAYGVTIDKCGDLPQEVRNTIGKGVLRLTLLELFVWRFMQTDPNWGNFLYDEVTGDTTLIDFGGVRKFDRDFVEGYLEIVMAASNGDEEGLMSKSIDMGFLDGNEAKVMLDAHLGAGLVLGEPFRIGGEYDFGSSNITSRIGEHARVFSQHRTQPPPPEVYTLHRKLAGAFLLCTKLNCKFECRELLDEVWGRARQGQVITD